MYFIAIYEHCLLPFLYALLRRVCLLYKAHAIMSLLLPSLLQQKHTNPLQPLLVHHMCWPCNHASAGLGLSVSLSYWQDQIWTHYSPQFITIETISGIIATLAKAAQYVASLHHHCSVTLTFSLLSTRTCRPFSRMLLLHLHICLCWTSACSSLLAPPVCWGPCEWPPCPPAYQSLLPRVVLSRNLLMVHSALLPNLLRSVKIVSAPVSTARKTSCKQPLV